MVTTTRRWVVAAMRIWRAMRVSKAASRCWMSGRVVQRARAAMERSCRSATSRMERDASASDSMMASSCSRERVGVRSSRSVSAWESRMWAAEVIMVRQYCAASAAGRGEARMSTSLRTNVADGS